MNLCKIVLSHLHIVLFDFSVVFGRLGSLNF
jgi:hypothetical protein